MRHIYDSFKEGQKKKKKAKEGTPFFNGDILDGAYGRLDLLPRRSDFICSPPAGSASHERPLLLSADLKSGHASVPVLYYHYHLLYININDNP